MSREGEGRRCDRCATVVIDLSGVTRTRAEAILAEHGGRMCGRIRTDARGEAIFAPEPVRMGLAPMAMAGLLAACAPEHVAPRAEPVSIAEPSVLADATTGSFGGSLATGTMMPLGPAPEPTPVALVSTAPIEEPPVEPTPEQIALTRRKRHQQWVRTHPPVVYTHTLGMMVDPY